MVRINNDIDLKKLEEFGFNIIEATGDWLFNKGICDYIIVYCQDRKIHLESYKGGVSLIKFLELYQTGFIEVVEGE